MTKSELDGVTVDKVLSKPYTREDLMAMDPVCLRALFRERVHHTIEVELYPILLGRKKMPKKFGLQAALLLDVWRTRAFPKIPMIFSVQEICRCRGQMRAGEKVELEEALPEPFTEQEMAVVRKLLWERRSVRDWVVGKPVPDHMIEQILEAGRAAPCGCNLDVVRFIVIRDPKEAKMVWSDIPTPMDQWRARRDLLRYPVYETVGHDTLVPAKHALRLRGGWRSHGPHGSRSWAWRCLAEAARRKRPRTFSRSTGCPTISKPALHFAIGGRLSARSSRSACLWRT